MAEDKFIDLTPEGAKKDPERVNKAAKDLEQTNMTLLNLSWQFIVEHLDDLKELAVGQAAEGNDAMMEDLDAIKEAQDKHNEASQEFLNAVGGR